MILLVKPKEIKYLYKFNKIKCQEDKNKYIITQMELDLKYQNFEKYLVSFQYEKSNIVTR